MQYESGPDWHRGGGAGRTRTGKVPASPGRGESGRDRDASGEAWARSWPSTEHAMRMRRSVQRGWRRLGFRRQFVMLLVAATLLSTLGTVIAGYIGARAIALNIVQTQVGRELQVAGQALAAHGKAVTQRDGQLYTEDGYRLNGDSTLIGQITALTGDGAAVYQVQGTQLIGIAGNLGRGDGVLGDSLSGAPFDALLGNCLATQPAVACQRSYQGVVTLHGASYIAAFMPLSDSGGAPTGALVVASPLQNIEMPLRLLAGVLLLIGLGLTAIFTVVAYRISGPVSGRAFAMLSDGLDDVAGAAARLGRLARTQTVHANRQTNTARHTMNELRALGEAAQALEHGVSLLRDAARQLWTERSFPAAPAGAGNGPQATRQIAVAASQLGGAADQASALCQSLRAMMNQIIAEAGILADNGRETDMRVHELARSLERIEVALGNRQMGFPFAARGGDESSEVDLDRSTRRVPALDHGTRATGSVRAVRAGGLTGESRAVSRQTGGMASTSGMGGTSGAGGVSAWPGDPSRSTGRHPSAASGPAPGPRPETSQSSAPSQYPQSAGFSHASPHRATSGGPRPTGSHPSTTGRHHAPWFPNERDLADALGQTGSMRVPQPLEDAHAGGSGGTGGTGGKDVMDDGRSMGGKGSPGGQSGIWSTGQAGDGQPGGQRLPYPSRPSPRPSPPPGSNDWMNDLR